VLALAHIVLHIGFCGPMLRLPPDATVAVHVRVSNVLAKAELDETFAIERDDDPEGLVEFDSAFGVYRLDLSAPKYGCSASDFLVFIPGRARSVTERLSRTPPAARMPVLLSGTAPQSFLYVNPTFVLFDESAVACGKPVPAPLPAAVRVENDQDSYYVWLYGDSRPRAPNSEQLALRLMTPTHEYHYVRIPVPFPVPRTGWPDSIQLNVTQDMVDGLATELTGTLLCPKLWETSAG
jgi:hypothetical protein